MTVSLYLTTDLQTQNPYLLNSAANFLLTPVVFFCDGRRVRILDGQVLPVNIPDSNRSWLEIAALVAAFIPGLLLGTIARALSYGVQEVRAGFQLILDADRPQVPLQPENVPAPAPLPPPAGFEPIETVIDKDILFFDEFFAVPDGELKAWLEKKKTEQDNVFGGAAVMEQSRAAFQDIDLKHLERLLELFQRATERIQALGLNDSAIESTAKAAASEISKAPTVAPTVPSSDPVPKAVVTVKAQAAAPKRPKPLPKELLDRLETIKKLMKPEEFNEYCSKCLERDPKDVLEKLNELSYNRRKGAIQRAVDRSTYFFIGLKDQPANKVAAYLASQKASKDYPYPFYLGADCTKNEAAYIKIVGTKIAITELRDHYKEASERITKLGHQECLKEKPPG